MSRLDEQATLKAKSPWVRRAVSRRMCDLRLSVAIYSGRTVRECKALLDARSALAYDDVYAESQTVGMFAGYCLRRGARRAGQEAIEGLLPKLTEARRHGKPTPGDNDTRIRQLARALRS
jgi:hypothetical protein